MHELHINSDLVTFFRYNILSNISVSQPREEMSDGFLLHGEMNLLLEFFIKCVNINRRICV